MMFDRSVENGVQVLALNGRLDAVTAPTVDQEFQAVLAEQGLKFVWDLVGLEYISSAGLRSVLQALKKVHAAGGQFAVCALNRNVLEVFEISGFKSLMTIFPDRTSAVAAMT